MIDQTINNHIPEHTENINPDGGDGLRRKRRIYILIAVVAFFIIGIYYIFFAQSTMSIIPDDKSMMISVNDVNYYGGETINIKSGMKKYHITASRDGYMSYQKDFTFWPYLTGAITPKLDKIIEVSSPAISEIIASGDLTYFVALNEYKIYKVQKNTWDQFLTESDKPKDINDLLAKETDWIDLNYLSDMTEYRVPFDFDVFDDKVIFQTRGDDSINYLMIYDPKKGYVTEKLSGIKDYNIFKENIYLLSESDEITYVRKTDLKNTSSHHKFDKFITSIWPADDGMYYMAKIANSNYEIGFLDSNKTEKIIDTGDIMNFSMDRSYRTKGSFEKMENGKYITYTINNKKTKSLEKNCQNLFYISESVYICNDYARINGLGTQGMETVIYKDDKVVERVHGSELVENIYYANNSIFLFYTDRFIILKTP